MRKWIGVSVLLGIFLVLSCHKGNKGPVTPACPEFEEPQPFSFELRKNGIFLSDSNYLAGIAITYSYNNGTNSVEDLVVSDAITTPDGIIHREVTSTNMALSSAYGTKIYYLAYPDTSKVDTLDLDVVRTPATNCEYVFNFLRVDNIIAKTDTPLVEQGDSTYILNHP